MPNPVTLVGRDITDTTATTVETAVTTTVETAGTTTTIETAATATTVETTVTTCLSRVVSAQKVFRSTNQYNILPRYSKIILKLCAEDLC